MGSLAHFLSLPLVLGILVGPGVRKRPSLEKAPKGALDANLGPSPDLTPGLDPIGNRLAFLCASLVQRVFFCRLPPKTVVSKPAAR